MLRKLVIVSLLAVSFVMAGCAHKVQNPIANIDSKQPDKVLFDRAMDSMSKGRYTEARTLLDTLLTTYPESEFVARAKLAKGDAWYAEGGTAGLQEAEVEYKDFITFFPNLPEAAEAQLKVAEIHFKQMEKPDRDYTQAMRAADEYKQLINQFPDSKLVPQAKQRLREVQEVLAERQWGIAHFYYLRNNLAASEARLISLMDSYPLFSGADESLFLLGSIYERQATAIRLQKKVPEGVREALSVKYEQKAIAAYSRIITRYPVMFRAEDARKRLEAMKALVPKATPEAIAQNQAEEDSRNEPTRFQELVANFRKRPDVSRTTDTGEPTMAEEEIDSAPALIQQLTAEVKEAAAVVGTGPAPGPNQPPPGSTPAQPAAADSSGSQPSPASAGQPASGVSSAQPSAAANPAATSSDSDLPVLPNAGSAPNSGAGNAATANPGAANANPGGGNATAANSSNAAPANAAPANMSAANVSTANPGAGSPAAGNTSPANPSAPPKQINDIGATSEGSTQSTTQNAQSGQQQNTNDQQDSSSKKKKKKGLRKLIPF